MQNRNYVASCRLRPFQQATVRHYNSLDGLPGEKVFALHCDAEGVTVQTDGGVARLAPGESRWQVLKDTDVFASKIVRRSDNLPNSAAQGESNQNGASADTAKETLSSSARSSAALSPYDTQFTLKSVTNYFTLPVRNPQHGTVGPGPTLWLGSPQGVARLQNGVWSRFAGRRWLAADLVSALAVDARNRAFVGTEAGVALLESVPMTWTEKAAHYESLTQTRHCREGFVTDCRLTTPGDLTTWLPIASDNDGLWTALYVAAKSFCYGVTGAPEARARARASLNALLRLVNATGIPGFPARALVRDGERVEISDPGPNWYPSPTLPDAWYKNDTSSDELDGHYLAWYVYSELVADAAERTQIAAACRAVTRHLLDHHYTLVGPTGKRTTWGVWSPEVLNHAPEWAAERGLNSLALLSHLRVALHLCPEPDFATAYRELVETHGYALNTVRQKMWPPEADCNHSDDELAACAYYPLLMLESDPVLRVLYLASLERTQTFLRPERSPLHAVFYGACTGRSCDAESAAQWLAECPLDLRNWTIDNTDRPDIPLSPERGRFGEVQLTRVPFAGESRIGKWNRNPYAAYVGDGGATEEDGAFWLLPYWMGRWHGIFRTDTDEPTAPK